MKTIKKISFGAFAFILGLTLVLTQSAFKGSPLKAFKRVPTTVYYHGPDFSQAEVQNESNWTTSTNSQTCDSSPQAPCRLIIDSSYILSGQLQGTANLTSSLYTGDDEESYFVTGSADEDMSITNKAQ
ncbi:MULTISPECIES: hypothetical protein [unclassified Pedobacter]|uniref:hypothetical protein n=1 Tax=unclassified Pedobacter TaxID=2628915 RepID=UPI001D6444F4|nr:MULTISPECIES: hypothetical protein [unclassified Pedobacter]CAH0266833.1 hypothetical protein SRABI36_03621 [Pedobacter sp. Bi36]CAH0293094.1 hypothetical protein SRABI126_04115 [Pedobacter sp. Bi126]